MILSIQAFHGNAFLEANMTWEYQELGNTGWRIGVLLGAEYKA